MIRMMVLVAALGISANSFAQMNKCVDAAGKTTYTQSPCPANTKSTAISKAVPPPTAPAAAVSAGDAAKGAPAAKGPSSPAEAEQAFRKRQQDQAEDQKKKQELAAQAQQKEQNCQQARSALAGLNAGGRQARFDEKGERAFLDDNQIALEKEKAQKTVEQSCK